MCRDTVESADPTDRQNTTHADAAADTKGQCGAGSAGEGSRTTRQSENTLQADGLGGGLFLCCGAQ